MTGLAHCERKPVLALASGASIRPCSTLIKRRHGTMALADIPAVHLARLFGSAAYAIFKKREISAPIKA
eukprot:6175939-Pleurochrysis_carterae.AAC.3